MRQRAGVLRKLGYRNVGELPDFLIAGRSKILMRKTRGPISGYTNKIA